MRMLGDRLRAYEHLVYPRKPEDVCFVYTRQGAGVLVGFGIEAPAWFHISLNVGGVHEAVTRCLEIEHKTSFAPVPQLDACQQQE